MLGHGAVETPWRPLPIAEDLAKRPRPPTAVVRETGADIHAQEHSLELQLPFLARVLPEVPIVPILMGEQTREVAFSLGGRDCRHRGRLGRCPRGVERPVSL